MSEVGPMQTRITRVGVIVPESNTTNEVEFNRLAPKDLSFHFARIPLHKDQHLDRDPGFHRDTLIKDLAVAASQLGSCSCDLIVFGCTSDSMKYGDDALVPVISDAADCPAITTATAIKATLTDLGVSRVAMASPYTDETNKEEAAFLDRVGFDVVAAKGLGLNTTLEGIKTMSRVSPTEVYDLAMSVDREEAEALLICCTDFNTLDVIEELEHTMGKPVVSSNLATFSMAMRHLNFPGGQAGFGQVIAALSRQD